jgi:hypoxanthine phosphoribosyltransferase
MAQEIDLGGTIYIPSKQAAEITGYTQDYIGQLARGGHILAQRVSGLWYVNEESLRSHKTKADEYKPTPPPVRQDRGLDSSVTFDGKEYVSTQRAAEMTGYHPDYVGQLARSGKILSRQVGNRWLVDRVEVAEHKRHNDALLAAVQTDSVGLMKMHGPEETRIDRGEDLHFSYEQQHLEDVNELPPIRMDPELATESVVESPPTVETAVTEIPIRVFRSSAVTDPAYYSRSNRDINAAGRSRHTYLGVAAFFIGLIGLGGSYLILFSNPTGAATTQNTPVTKSGYALSDRWEKILALMPNFLAQELYYDRSTF